MFKPPSSRPWLLLAVVALIAAACGDSDTDSTAATTSVVAATTTSEAGVTTTSGATDSTSITTSTTAGTAATTTTSVVTTTTGATQTLSVFFSGEVDVDCSPVIEFQRAAPAAAPPMKAAFDELVGGPTSQEQAEGGGSMFDATTAGFVRSAQLTGDLLTVDFDNFSAIIPNASTSCGSEALLAQLNATAFQFPDVERVRYTFEGSCNAFYNWLQRDCTTHERSDSEPFSTDMSARTGPSVGPQSGQLIDVRLAGQEGFDRFVLEIDGTGTPQYWVQYVERPVLNIPGEEVEVDGEFVLAVTISPARNVDIEDPSFPKTYEGPLLMTSDTSNVVEAVWVSDFEATNEWVLGLERKTGFEVFTLTGPSRLVVDISHN